ncbi:chorismate mutase [Micromonospora siamensis]|uniref:Chorismate mutase n=1 Tax=Micromonospora siamensis TaxID=299152 RepID=A0A1C5K4E2_9ACTN|nr:chorismate mutase [Micromonospora siamensis]SCG77658.1 chorismate mutase [Micromonospora siamensis]
MMADVMQSDGAQRAAGDRPDAVDGGAGDDRPAGTGTGTGTEDSAAAARIVAIRERIDEIDRTMIDLWQERAALSQQVGATRIASGGTRLVLSRERQILERFREALGADGTQLALLLLRAGRGPL